MLIHFFDFFHTTSYRKRQILLKNNQKMDVRFCKHLPRHYIHYNYHYNYHYKCIVKDRSLKIFKTFWGKTTFERNRRCTIVPFFNVLLQSDDMKTVIVIFNMMIVITECSSIKDIKTHLPCKAQIMSSNPPGACVHIFFKYNFFYRKLHIFFCLLN